jgi:DNA-binding transcriptional LysR family regulator
MPLDERLGRRLNLRDLQTLMAVAETGGIGKAADRLNYSQPAVSKAIAKLERTVGKRLLERGRKGIELTPYGDALLRCGVAVFDDLRKGIEEIDFLADPASGEVRIGCSEVASIGLIAEVIARVVRRYPRITFHLEPAEPPDLYRELDARNVDLVITRIFRPVAQETMQTEVLYDEAVAVVAGLRHPLTRRRRIKFADFVEERWVLPPATSFINSLVADAFRKNGLGAPRVAVVAPFPHLRIMLVAQGHFLTVVPTVLLKTGANQLGVKVLPVELHDNRRPVGIVTLKNRALSPVAQLFIEHTRAVANAMAKG